MITNIILKDEIYAILFSLYTELNEENIQSLKKVQDNDAILCTKLSFSALKVNAEFRMDYNVRQEYSLIQSRSSTIVSKIDAEPFEELIHQLLKIGEIESPMCQLEHIYKCCTKEIQRSLDQFWRQYDIPGKKLAVDVDNL
jgi:hypothetical protein